MSSIDERIVQMKFDNNQFESGVKTTLDSLENLKKGLDFSNLEAGVTELQKRFSTLGIAGMEITKRLTNAVIDAGKSLTNMTLGQIKSGGMSRALNLEQAQFRLQGILKDTKKVEAAMNAAGNAVDGTAYGLDEAASAASVLAASGVDVETQLEGVLTSISGAAAMTGRSYSDIADIYSTVASNGKLMTMQLRQFSAAGLNVSAVLKEAGVNGATTEEQINEMVTKGQISFEQFSDAMARFGEHAKEANKTFSGSLANMKSALNRIGELFAKPYVENMRYVFNAIRDLLNKVKQSLGDFSEYIEKHMKRIRKSVVRILKVLTGKYDKNKLILSPIVYMTKTLVNAFKILINIFKPVKKAFREVFPKATVSSFSKMVKALYELSNGILKKVKNQSDNLRNGFKGLFVIVDSIGSAIKFLVEVVKAITKPFGGLINIIGSTIGYFGKVIQGIHDFISSTEGISRIPKNIISFVGDLSQKLHDFIVNSESLKGIPDFFIKIGKTIDDLVLKLRDFINDSKLIQSLPDLFSDIVDVLKDAKDSISDFFSSFAETDLFSDIKNLFSEIKELITNIFDIDLSDAVDNMREFVKQVKDLFNIDSSKLVVVVDYGINGLAKAIKALLNFDFKTASKGFKKFMSVIKTGIDEVISYISDLNFGAIVDKIISAGIFVALTNLIQGLSKLVYKFNSVFKDRGIDIKEGVGNFINSLSSLSSALKDIIQTNKIAVQAAALLIYSAALVSFSYAVSKLASIDSQSLVRGLVSIGILIKMMSRSLDTLRSVVAGSKIKGIYQTAFSLLIFASAIKGLAKTVIMLSDLNWGQLIKGLAGLGTILFVLTKFMSSAKFDGLNVKAGAGLVLVAYAIRSMGKAVEQLGDLNVAQLAKGLVSVGVLLAEIAGFTRIVGNPKGMISTGAGLILLAVGIRLLTDPISDLGNMKLPELAKGLGAFAITMAVLTAAVNLMPGAKMITIGSGLLIMSAGIIIITSALKILSTIKIENMGVALLGLVGSLAALGLLAKLVNPVSLIGTAAALVIFAVSIMLLTPSLLLFSKIGIEGLAISLGMLAGIFLIFGAAAKILTPVIPAMLALGAAIIVLGVGVIATGAGLLVLSLGLTQFAIAVVANSKAIVVGITTIISGILSLLPTIGAALADAILEFIATLANGITKVTEAGVKLGTALLNSLTQLIPQLISTGLTLIMALLQGIASNIELIATYGLAIISKLILGLARGIGTLIQSGIALMFAFVNGLAQGIRENSELVVVAAKNMMSAVVEAILSVLQALLQNIPVIGDEISDGLDSAKESVREFFDVEEAEKMSADYINGVSKGIDDGINNIKNSAKNVGEAVEKPTTEGFHKLDNESQEGVAKVAENISNGKADVGVASEGLSEEITGPMRETLKEAGYTGEEIDNMLGQGMTDNLGAIQAGAENMTGAANAEYDKATKTAAKKAKEQSTAYAKALDPKTAANAAKGIATRVAKNLDAGRKTALSAGKSLVKEYSGGIQKNSKTAETAARNMAQSSGRGAGNSGAKLTANNAGQELGNGFVKGINAKQQSAYDAGYKLGAKAAQGVKDGEKSSSPSKLGIIAGKYLGEGLVLGINSMDNAAYRSGYNIGKIASDALTKAASKVNDVLNSDLDTSPRITPVLDLSNVENGINRMNGMLDTRSMSASISGNMGRLSLVPGYATPSNSVANNTTNTINITVDGTENPEAFADRLVRQFQLRGRMA